eukprot:PhM_4_TR4933/c0_g1_i1/m.102197
MLAMVVKGNVRGTACWGLAAARHIRDLLVLAVLLTEKLLGVGVAHNHPHPIVANKVLQFRTTCEHSLNALNWGIHHEEGTHWRVHLRHLRRQSCTQITRCSLENTDVTNNVEGHLRSRRLLGVSRRKEVLEVDAGAHQQRGAQHMLEVCALLVVQRRVVLWEEGTAVEETTLRQHAATDNHRGIGCMIQLWTGFGGVDRPLMHMHEGILGCHTVLCKEESVTTLERVVAECRCDVSLRLDDVALVGHRDKVKVEVLYGVGSGVVHPTKEDSVVGDNDAVLLLETLPHRRVVAQAGDQTSVRTTFTPRARATVVGSEVGVVHAACAMPEDDHEPREVVQHASILEGAGQHAGTFAR